MSPLKLSSQSPAYCPNDARVDVPLYSIRSGASIGWPTGRPSTYSRSLRPSNVPATWCHAPSQTSAPRAVADTTYRAPSYT
jgi:hypothetical protein